MYQSGHTAAPDGGPTDAPPLDMTLGIAVFFAVELYIGHIARSTVRHKHHIIVYSGYGIALSSHSRYLNSLKQR